MASEIQQQPVQPVQPVIIPSLFTTLGVTGGILFVLAVAAAKTLPKYLDRFFQLREASIKARIEQELREKDSDLRRDESTHGALTDFSKTLLANQLQTGRQYQEEIAAIQQIQSQQIAIILRELEKSASNQMRFFDLADQVKKELAEIKLEIEKNRKAIYGKPD